MNDEITIANRAHWEREAKANGGFTVPWLDLKREDILSYSQGRLDPVPKHLFQIYPASILKDVSDKKVLCLAAGGGQQSAVFGLLGAKVTVVDFAQGQLDGDTAAANHYGYEVVTICENICDLSSIAGRSFDLVYQGPSMSWVPSVHDVYSGVSGLVKPGGRYRVDFLNPANHFMEWDGEHYRVTKPYSDRMWKHKDGAFDFRHYFGEIFNGLIENQFSVEFVDDHPWTVPDLSSTPGSWSHEMAYNVSIVVVARKHA